MKQQLFDKEYLEFDVVGSTSFDPIITASKTGRWEFGDATIADANSVTKVYSDTATYHVKYWLRELSDVTAINMVNDGISESLDLSGLTGLGGHFRIYSNPLLTSITNPTSSQIFTNYYASSCNLDYIDFTTLANMLSVNNSNIRLQDNGMTVTDVNHILVDLYSLISGEAVGGDYTGRTINISGTNAAPDGSSGGFDGTTAVTNLQGKGIAVSTS